MKHPEKIKETRRRYASLNRERNKERSRNWANANKEKIKARNIQNKKRCLLEYSENKLECKCCGTNDMRFLTLDHINNDGAYERERNGRLGGIPLYNHLCSRGFPNKERYHVLCWNCNCGRHNNLGVCPHKDIGDTK